MRRWVIKFKNSFIWLNFYIQLCESHVTYESTLRYLYKLRMYEATSYLFSPVLSNVMIICFRLVAIIF